MQFNNVHRRHCQSGTIHHAADVAVQRDVVEIVASSFDLAWILLRPVPLVKDGLLTALSIVIETNFGIKAEI